MEPNLPKNEMPNEKFGDFNQIPYLRVGSKALGPITTKTTIMRGTKIFVIDNGRRLTPKQTRTWRDSDDYFTTIRYGHGTTEFCCVKTENFVQLIKGEIGKVVDSGACVTVVNDGYDPNLTLDDGFSHYCTSLFQARDKSEWDECTSRPAFPY